MVSISMTVVNRLSDKSMISSSGAEDNAIIQKIDQFRREHKHLNHIIGCYKELKENQNWYNTSQIGEYLNKWLTRCGYRADIPKDKLKSLGFSVKDIDDLFAEYPGLVKTELAQYISELHYHLINESEWNEIEEKPIAKMIKNDEWLDEGDSTVHLGRLIDTLKRIQRNYDVYNIVYSILPEENDLHHLTSNPSPPMRKKAGK